MTLVADRALVGLVGGVIGLLTVSSTIGWAASRWFGTGVRGATIDNVNARIRAWWWMALLFVVAALTGRTVSLTLFCVTSLLALREFVTLAPTRPGDHRALFWLFFIVTPPWTRNADPLGNPPLVQ